MPRSRSVFSSSVQLRASFFLSLSSSCAGSVSARVGRGQRGYVPSFRRTCTRTRPRSRVPRAAASSGSASRLGGRGRGRPVWERGSAATRQRSDRDAFEGREMKGWAYGTRTHLSLLNFDDTSRRVSLLREHRRVHFRRRLIVVDPALCELFLLLEYVSVSGRAPSMDRRTHRGRLRLGHKDVSALLAPLDLEEFVKLQHAPLAAEVALQAWRRMRASRSERRGIIAADAPCCLREKLAARVEDKSGKISINVRAPGAS